MTEDYSSTVRLEEMEQDFRAGYDKGYEEGYNEGYDTMPEDLVDLLPQVCEDICSQCKNAILYYNEEYGIETCDFSQEQNRCALARLINLIRG